MYDLYYQAEISRDIKRGLLVLFSFLVIGGLDYFGLSDLIYHIIYAYGGVYITSFFSAIFFQFVMLQDNFLLFLVAIVVFYILNTNAMLFFWFLSLLTLLVLYTMGVFLPDAGEVVMKTELDSALQPLFFDNVHTRLRENISLEILLFGFLFFRSETKQETIFTLTLIYLSFFVGLIFDFLSISDLLLGSIVGLLMSFFLYMLTNEFRNFNPIVNYILISFNCIFSIFVLFYDEDYYFNTNMYITLALITWGYTAYYAFEFSKMRSSVRMAHSQKKHKIVTGIRRGIVDKI